MHQPITLAKLRKPITVKVGGNSITLTWIPLVSPDEPFSTHHNKRVALTAQGEVNEDYEMVAVGRMDNKYPDLSFLTPEEKKAADEEAKRNDAALSRQREDADLRQEQMEAAAEAKAQSEHRKKVLELNEINDAIRTQAEDRVKEAIQETVRIQDAAKAKK